MNNVHGVAVDPADARVFVDDRANHRVQCSTRTGSTSLEWKIAVRSFGACTSSRLARTGRFVTFDRNRTGQDDQGRPRWCFLRVLVGHCR